MTAKKSVAGKPAQKSGYDPKKLTDFLSAAVYACSKDDSWQMANNVIDQYGVFHEDIVPLDYGILACLTMLPTSVIPKSYADTIRIAWLARTTGNIFDVLELSPVGIEKTLKTVKSLYHEGILWMEEDSVGTYLDPLDIKLYPEFIRYIVKCINNPEVIDHLKTEKDIIALCNRVKRFHTKGKPNWIKSGLPAQPFACEDDLLLLNVFDRMALIVYKTIGFKHIFLEGKELREIAQEFSCNTEITEKKKAFFAKYSCSEEGLRSNFILWSDRKFQKECKNLKAHGKREKQMDTAFLGK